ncbi:NVEALA domain-containing protein [Phocaeicola massiliensis]|uniref:NVEALA domain-containing protein n=1 Tax=Phocaeicola massiliensis TaxID=204516 RepID=UPI003A521BFD
MGFSLKKGGLVRCKLNGNNQNGFNVYNSQKSDVMSELALANVEALATGEDDWSYRLFPCAHKPWNECVLSTDTRRDPCSSSSYC